ncbi:SPFH domain-containing protein [Nocardiopsis algeriensis]|uniref:Regulator of protease activity HflC (Stomatin/prohibitin superfamily) n=1 Tax=Nocardiopsis algeriensis TaxID=1478215 RepID=A0A841IR59_9ACTN|nr:SPFH domain-containing protein [Nocardiopsis algeriensis]MBB6119105.1 regulator of protease activity HflC (stomatin/prohibitin superfamily) [Nocardiopsis algeriensis]
MSQPVNSGGGSSIKESLASWGDLAALLRGGEQGALVPVVIPKDNRGLRWTVLVWFGLYALASALMMTVNAAVGGPLQAVYPFLAVPTLLVGVLGVVVAVLWWWRGSIIEIEHGTTGILSKYGEVTGVIGPGRHYLWHPWKRVDYVVDTSTEIPYTAPVLACPTRENVPLKSIEFFLKFRIVDPQKFVLTIGASNFDLVLSSAVQDAIRQRSRQVRTESAYDLRGSNVEDMRRLLNQQLEQQYGVSITGCNIPDVQLPNQYQQHLATRERVSKELVAYEQEWELTRKRRIDTLLMDIERSKKVRDAKIVEVNASLNKARKDVAQMLQEQETEAQRVRYEIETRGRADLVAAENEAKAQHRLATAYRDNRAVLEYELARRRLDVGAALAERAPRPVVVQTEAGTGDTSALSTLLTAQLLPQVLERGAGSRAPGAAGEAPDPVRGSVAAAAARQQEMAEGYVALQENAMREQFQRGDGYEGRGRR